MKLRNLRVETNPRLMIIPMIDIIFFLLVFFMMSTLYLVEQRTLLVHLPQAATSQNQMNKQVTITLTSDGRIMVNQEEVAGEMIKPRLQAEISRNPEAAFVLRADRSTEYGKVVAVLDQLKVLGVARVSVATELAVR